MSRRSLFSLPAARAATGALALAGMGFGLGACSSTGGSAGAGASSSDGSCSGVSGAHHARVVVEPSAGTVVAHCVGFAPSTISATTLLHDSGVELGTQDFGGSLGLGICQVDHVPAHYSQCLPSNADYWAVFVSSDGKPWVSPSTGVSQVTLHPGDSLGLRYDSPQGDPAPPPAPRPA
ncbi:MAG: hypothetical protein KGJ77_09045 [Acidobacteriota bacterium]|nr:hypothetical protein [Acidobacteriota bacterium]